MGTDILDNHRHRRGLRLDRLHAGRYGAAVPIRYLLQDTGGAVSYSMTFNVSVVPEPASLAMLLSGALLLGLYGWRRRRA